MRTTVTLDPDVEALLRRLMRKKHLSFKAALNQAIRDGIAGPSRRAHRGYSLKTHRMGFRPEVALDRALGLAAALEDEEIARKLSLRK
ncbi:MAG: hypothetical protein JO332_15640 [Planctomycetaceae bacterium]|nr:hypothetical protein [Planctomycetaceae bacterium]